MNVRQVLSTIADNEKTIVFVIGKQPKTETMKWYHGDDTKYDNRDVISVTYQGDTIKIRIE